MNCKDTLLTFHVLFDKLQALSKYYQLSEKIFFCFSYTVTDHGVVDNIEPVFDIASLESTLSINKLEQIDETGKMLVR